MLLRFLLPVCSSAPLVGCSSPAGWLAGWLFPFAGRYLFFFSTLVLRNVSVSPFSGMSVLHVGLLLRASKNARGLLDASCSRVLAVAAASPP